MYLSIVFLPLLSAFVAGLLGKFLGNKISSYFTTICLGITFILSIIAFYEVALCASPCYLTTISWIKSELFHVNWGFLFDTLTVVMLIVVTSVSFLVHMYSIEYMSHDPHLSRFMCYLSFFTFFMLILVTADNFLQMFVGWEGVGLCSYLLINFYFTRIQANKSAIKAMIMNRIGDFGLSLGMMAIFLTFKSLNYDIIFTSVNLYSHEFFLFLNFEVNKITLICILLFVGAVGKSAQVGLHTWLPDAMEGPTPVSALIHAATMVTAGVFLIARCSPLFEYSTLALSILTIFGATTAFFAATTGLLQNDIKRVIAYSTCSQLGYMVFSCGISSYSAAVFHLANHAFFKALLFLTAGSIIHSFQDEQDMRKMGGLGLILPYSYSMILIGSLSLMGFPFLTGFYSKDIILELAYSTYSIDSTFAYWLGTISAFFTAFYSFRLIYLVFLNKPNGYKNAYQNADDSHFWIALPLSLLAFGSIFIGYLSKDMMLGLGTNFWGNSLFLLSNHTTILDSEYIDYYLKLIPVIFSLIGSVCSYLLYRFSKNFLFTLNLRFKTIYIFFNKRWLFDKIYNEFIGLPALSFGYNISFKLLDRGFFEIFGPYGLAFVLLNFAKNTSRLQTGLLYHYIFIFILGLTFFVGLIKFGEQFFIYAFIFSFVYLIFITKKFK
uniref:NADH-ubiquinone oxidoreductase chain 5 n=1 Tax=Glaucocystis nostochinearum TaxID=38271 RepID=E9P6C4_9EUKA|nr:NADH dehydrogenase subunit 5 [Glaucocystis nostochinearum]ADW83108.1 NADH dehydrogenase subunit 5 [Glaucocystis nostochinearum]